jgi:hypothetical protein
MEPPGCRWVDLARVLGPNGFVPFQGRVGVRAISKLGRTDQFGSQSVDFDGSHAPQSRRSSARALRHNPDGKT